MAAGRLKALLSQMTAGGGGKAGKAAGGGGLLLAGAAGLIYGASQSFYTVDGGHRAIIFSRIGGIQDAVYSEGLHFRIPWFHYPIIYDIRAKPRRITSPTGSKDLQMVNIGLRVLARPVASTLPRMYQRLGLDYDERVLPSICNETLKSVVAQFNASQLITMRQEVSLMIRKDLVERAKDFDIILDDVAITDLSFSQQYTAAVESKQVAQQEAQRAAFLVERAIQERQQKIVAAEGEAKSATLLGEAMSSNPGYLKLKRIETARKIATVISQSQNKVYLNANNLLLNVKDTGEIDQALNPITTDEVPPLPEIPQAVVAEPIISTAEVKSEIVEAGADAGDVIVDKAESYVMADVAENSGIAEVGDVIDDKAVSYTMDTIPENTEIAEVQVDDVHVDVLSDPE